MTNSMQKLFNLGLVSLAGLMLLTTACTSETEQSKAPIPQPDESKGTREVLLTLKNRLAIPASETKADDQPIATAAENAISALDVYVFAAEEEDGEYSFMERFAYRSNPDDALPVGANKLQLTPTDADVKEATGLLKVKRGLFVKLYCVANNTTFIDPVSNKAVEATDFTPLTASGKEGEKQTIATAGKPLESTFASYHTHLLSAATPADTLVTPLAMTGAMTTPLDLTDFGSAARVQAGIRLTRLVARYDIINQAGSSRLIIETVSMGNARRGSGLFPIKPYGDLPDAKTGDLITMPIRHFYGEKANKGMQTGAFYSYPSPVQDKGFLILKGKYQINQSESKEVSYQIPFTQQGTNGNATALEINNNHRYTLAITDADEYHLDCTLTVADWTDNGSIDDYTPGTETGEISISVPKGDTETKYDPDNHIVTMSLNANTTFEMTMKKTSPILPTMTKTYAGGFSAKQYDWLEITPPVVTTSAPLSKAEEEGYKYTFALKADYTENRYPRAIVRFTNLTSGEETVLFVDALAAPTATTTIQDGKNNPNTFDPDALEADVYRLTDSNLRIKLLCSAGVELDCPDWLTPKLLSENNGEQLYSFTLNDVNAAPQEEKGVLIIKNAKYPDKKISVTVNLLVPDIAPNFTDLGGDGSNSFTPANDATPANVTMSIAENNTFKFTSLSFEGIKIDMNFDGGPKWLAHDGQVATKTASVPNTITFSLVKEKLFGAKMATITLKNKTLSGGKDYIFTVTPNFVEPELTSSATMTLEAKTDKAVPTIQITGNCFGGSQIVADESPEWLTYETTSTTENTFSYKISLIAGVDKKNFPTSLPVDQTITLANKSNPDKKTTVTVSFTDQGAWIDEEINQDEVYTNSDGTKTNYRVKTTGKTLTLTVYSMFTATIPTVETSYDPDYGTNTSWLPAPTSPTTTGYGNSRRKFTYEIVVPATSGTDPDYQLHKGTITVKQANTELKKMTIWRGASNIPYPTGRNDNAYYSAVKRGDIWWAPINLGASEIAKNATSVSSAGKLYQWGRNVPTTYGSIVQIAGPVSADTADEFITSSGDWLSPKNDYLWREGQKTDKDPCPQGWRVPTSNELGKWVSGTWAQPLLTIPGQNGINLILPAAGIRYYGSGSSGSQGSWGGYWSSSVYLHFARHMTFNGTVNADYTSRGSGLSLRCVQE